MRYMGWALIILAALEVISIILVSNLIGGGWTLLLIILSIACGVFMLRNIGLSGLFLAVATLRTGSNVSLYQLLWPLRYVLAAIMLISPGFVSDIFAALLLLPISGKPLANTSNNPFSNTPQPDQSDIIEGEFTVENNNGQTHHPNRQQHLPPKQPD
ncbi:FxsA family protein [Snodgrassella gandavensis]|uniref:FxsA family protein n=1 Tax=Snodgrassella gandavensis TaxID=2946698 RepID=UPI001EF61FA8|nr:FxsA family protein [Snodgrassella gandavensis]